MLSKLSSYYETAGIYRANPCDVDTHRALKPLGRTLARFGSHCPCCSGARVVGAAILGTLFPITTSLALGALFAAILAKEIIWPTEDEHAEV